MKNLRWYLFLYQILLCISAGSAQVGAAFPQIRGSLLDGRTVKLPLNNNKFSIVAIVFDRAAGEDLKMWLDPIYERFLVKSEENVIFDVAEIYDVNVVFIPMIEGFKRVATSFKAGTDKDFWPYVMDAEDLDIRESKKLLTGVDSKVPYLYVINNEGKIVLVQTGKYTEAKMEAIEEILE